MTYEPSSWGSPKGCPLPSAAFRRLVSTQPTSDQPRRGFPDVPSWLSVILFITCKDAGNSFQKGLAGGLENELKIVELDMLVSCAAFHIRGAGTAFPELF